MNVKLLSIEDLMFLRSRYSIYIDDDHIVVRIIGFERETWHEKGKKFSILAPIRKITFCDEELRIWERISMYNLFDVHNAYVKLKITYQPITESAIVKLIKEGN